MLKGWKYKIVIRNINEMMKATMEDFTAIFVPHAECLYLCNTDVSLSSSMATNSKN